MIRTLAALSTLLFLSATPVAAADPIRIGDMNSYTSLPAFSVSYRMGWQLAVEEINAAGGVLGRKLEVVSRDDGGKPADAVTVANELVARERVEVLAGTLLSHVGLAVADYANQRRIVFIAAEPLTDALAWEQGNPYTFRLRPGVTFSDGAPVDAEAVALNFDIFGLGERELGYPVSEVVNNYERSEVIDPLTVKFYFPAPSPGFLQGTSVIGSGLVSPATLEQPFNELGDATRIIGSGPFVVESETLGQSLTLVAREDYDWAPPSFEHQGRAYLDGIQFIITPEDSVRIGALLAEDPRVDLISFTGSTATGKSVMRAASESLKKVFLELGGKSAFVVLDDADLRAACSMAAFTVCTHAGQGCAITTRLLVPRARYDEAVEATAKTLQGLRPGDPRDSGTICGPLISARQRDRVEGYIRLAVEEGGTVVVGGGRPTEHDRGFFVEPTLISGLDNSARTAQEEIFGPVLVILPHDGDDDAVRIANDSPYGLSGAVYGTDPDRIARVVAGVRTGTLGVNGGIWYAADAPFGGYKQSGIGREMGLAGFEEYLETKLVAEPAS